MAYFNVSCLSKAVTNSSKLSYGLKSVTDHGLVDFDHEVEEVKNLLSTYISADVPQNSLAGLRFVDSVLRLGIEYHFQEEIIAILLKEYSIFSTSNKNNIVIKDLQVVALRFRLLRQEGYTVSSDVFKKFMDSTGNFNPLLVDQEDGLIELFEASQLSLEEEQVLEEAEDFCRGNLNTMFNRLEEDNRARKKILNSLEQPYHKSLARLTAINFLNSYEGINNEEYLMVVLQNLARKDFKVLQSIHQKEIDIVFEWWRDLGLAKELKFARNQPLKWYTWTVAILSDPSLSEQRIELTKPISLIYIIDDIFDVYGTLDELSLFTDIVNNWDIIAAENLPYKLKICFKALDGITSQISHIVYKKYSWDPTDSLKKAWAKLCNAFLVEARWFESGNLPGEEEYLKNAIVSSGVHVALVHTFFLLGQGITQQTVCLLDHIPILISSTATILRLWDDLGNAKNEDQNGHDGSYVECYMRQREGCCSEEETRDHVKNMIKIEWKRLNKQCVVSNSFPLCFKRACLNSARMVPIMYDYDHNQNLPSLQHYITTLLS